MIREFRFRKPDNQGLQGQVCSLKSYEPKVEYGQHLRL